MTVATTLGLTSAPTTHTRLLGWVADVAALEGDTDATETPIGYVPAPDAIDTSGLGPTDRDLRTALNDGIAAWAAAVAQIRAWFTRFGDKLPAPSWAEFDLLAQRLQ
jgi:phosphoenolpyruvate carboxykinase (GTP)